MSNLNNSNKQVGEEKPTAAFALSLVGGILQLLLGIVIAAFFVAVGFLTLGAGWVVATLGAYELVLASITIIGAIMMYNNPSSAHTWGIVILMLSIISGLNIFSLIGGILGIVWKPQVPTAAKKLFSPIVLAEIIVFVALAVVLSLVSHSFFSLPQGGSINIGMIPVFWLALRRGPRVGIFAGAVFGMADLAIEPFIVHPIQFILDYPLAFAALGLAGFFQKWRVFGPVTGVVVGGTGRFLSHFVSGMVYFANYAPTGQSPAVYSLIYNGTYMFPSIAICVIVILSLQASKSLDIYL